MLAGLLESQGFALCASVRQIARLNLVDPELFPLPQSIRHSPPLSDILSSLQSKAAADNGELVDLTDNVASPSPAPTQPALAADVVQNGTLAAQGSTSQSNASVCALTDTQKTPGAGVGTPHSALLTPGPGSEIIQKKASHSGKARVLSYGLVSMMDVATCQIEGQHMELLAWPETGATPVAAEPQLCSAKLGWTSQGGFGGVLKDQQVRHWLPLPSYSSSTHNSTKLTLNAQLRMQQPEYRHG